MTRRSWFLGLTAALAAVFAVASAQAQPGGTPGGGRPSHEGFLQKKLGLSDDQAKQMRQIHESQADARKQNMQSLRTAEQELRRAVLSGTDEATVHARQTDVANLMAESIRLRVENLKQVSSILTPEQRQKFAEMGQHRGPHGGRGKHPRPQGQQG